jgi:hypothetical protein
MGIKGYIPFILIPLFSCQVAKDKPVVDENSMDSPTVIKELEDNTDYSLELVNKMVLKIDKSTSKSLIYKNIKLKNGKFSLTKYSTIEGTKIEFTKDSFPIKKVQFWYLKNGKLIFLREQLTNIEEMGEEEKLYTEENYEQYYFQNNKVVRVLIPFDCGAPNSKDFRVLNTRRLLKELEEINSY